MRLNDEIALLEDQCRSLQIVIVNLAAGREKLEGLPRDPKRQRLLDLQQDIIEAARESLRFSQSTLAHLHSLDRLPTASMTMY